MFGSNFKRVEKQFPNFIYLVYCEIELFSTNILGYHMRCAVFSKDASNSGRHALLSVAITIYY